MNKTAVSRAQQAASARSCEKDWQRGYALMVSGGAWRNQENGECASGEFGVSVEVIKAEFG
jgi:roadblock/LC7 domain-containing protein